MLGDNCAVSQISDSLFRVQRLTERQNMQLLIQLRWIAVVGQVVTISLVHYGFQIALPLLPMALVLVALVATNLAYIYWSQGLHRPVTSRSVFYALLADVLALTIQLYLSGGASNPFIYLYLLQGILSAVLLPAHYTWCVVAASFVGVLGLTLFHQPLHVQFVSQEGLPSLYVVGVLISFALTSILTIVFLTRIVENTRRRDKRISNMRQRASEEEHIVRLGLLATGAAHELGTPMATMSVILGDWQHDKRLTSNAALKEDIAEMQTQVQRCKSIVSGILLSAGETRGEASVQTTVRKFVDALAEEWRSTRTIPQFDYDNDFGTDTPMVSDTTLKQMVFNVLDNARDASPSWVRLAVTRNADALCMTVTDAGPGFAPDMLSKLGTPYQSSKNRPGGGLGLYLVLNVARTLGGSVEARNRPEGGAQVTIELPLASIALPQKV